MAPARNLAEEPSRGHAMMAIPLGSNAISEECDLNQTSKAPIDLGLRLGFLDCVVFMVEGRSFRRHAARIDDPVGPLASRCISRVGGAWALHLLPVTDGIRRCT